MTLLPQQIRHWKTLIYMLPSGLARYKMVECMRVPSIPTNAVGRD